MIMDREKTPPFVQKKWFAPLLAFLVLWQLAALKTACAAREAVSPALLEQVFPGADAAGPFVGDPPAATVTRNGREVGYLLSTRDVVSTGGFAGKPFDILVGIDQSAHITGAVMLEHHEPILVIGVTNRAIDRFVAQFAGIDIRHPIILEKIPDTTGTVIDGISGATISSVVMTNAVLRAARIVARAKGLIDVGIGKGGTLLLDRYQPADWRTLTTDGSLAVLRLSNGNMDARFKAKGVPLPATENKDGLFLELITGLATPAGIGRNLLGERLYNELMALRGDGGQLLFIAARGRYSFKGTSWVRKKVFNRIQIVQGDKTLHLTKAMHHGLEAVAAQGAPELREMAVFVLPADWGLDVTKPWRLDLSVRRFLPNGDPVYTSVSLPYVLPAAYIQPPSVTAAPASGQPLWLSVWHARMGRIAILVAALGVLTAVLFFQDVIARHPKIYKRLHLGFLLFTLLWLGWYAGAQLSVLNIITFVQALLTGFRWDFFLLEPLIFILWGYVAVTLLFWGRGVFCGWLCPFGALQELLNTAARRLGLHQISLPFGLHERLWALKYVLFLGLFAVSLNSISYAIIGTEIEPFKTAISLKFMRAWPFVLYAVGLLVAGLFIERAYCRYLCPLGAALAVPTRLRLFEWLKRKRQCGTGCDYCAEHCTVQAIHPNGQIAVNECVYCLECQINYNDENVCPPLITRRRRREARAAQRAAAAEKRGHSPLPGA